MRCLYCDEPVREGFGLAYYVDGAGQEPLPAGWCFEHVPAQARVHDLTRWLMNPKKYAAELGALSPDR